MGSMLWIPEVLHLLGVDSFRAQSLLSFLNFLGQASDRLRARIQLCWSAFLSFCFLFAPFAPSCTRRIFGLPTRQVPQLRKHIRYIEAEDRCGCAGSVLQQRWTPPHSRDRLNPLHHSCGSWYWSLVGGRSYLTFWVLL